MKRRRWRRGCRSGGALGDVETGGPFAEESGQTLVGFLRGDVLNVYRTRGASVSVSGVSLQPDYACLLTMIVRLGGVSSSAGGLLSAGVPLHEVGAGEHVYCEIQRRAAT